MHITKYEHACVVVEEDGKKLVIDPGDMTSTFGQLHNIVAVVVTHQHGDHFDKNHLQAIIAQNPDVQIFMPHDTAEQYDDPHVTPVTGGEEKLVHPFTLTFYGELHALHHPTLPRPQNIAIFVNNVLFHPGDSFTIPEGVDGVPILALPGSAPWMKLGEAMDYLIAVHPEHCFMIHDAVLSEAGRAIHARILSGTASANGVTFNDLLPGDSIDA